MTTRALLLVVLAAVALAGCTVAGVPIVNSVNGALTLVLLVANLTLLGRAVRRQITTDDAIDVRVRRAQAKHGAGAEYVARLRGDGEIEFCWDVVDEHCPLGWRTGFLTGKTLREVLSPEAFAETAPRYLAGLTGGVPAVWTRVEPAPGLGAGATATVRYALVPMGDGCVCVDAVPLSPDIDAVVTERDALRTERDTLAERVALLSAETQAMRRQALAERSLGLRADAPADGC